MRKKASNRDAQNGMRKKQTGCNLANKNQNQNDNQKKRARTKSFITPFTTSPGCVPRTKMHLRASSTSLGSRASMARLDRALRGFLRRGKCQACLVIGGHGGAWERWTYTARSIFFVRRERRRWVVEKWLDNTGCCRQIIPYSMRRVNN